MGETLAGKWHLDRLVGVGGMAAVYAATHRNGATAAIKVLHARYAKVPEIFARFQREAYIANKIDHPGVVRVSDDDVTAEGEPYLVMELLEGEPLDLLQRRAGGMLPIRDALMLADRALAVLEVAHGLGIIHRDLKPENLFLTKDRQLKVLDFGIARLAEGTNAANRTRTGLIMGTPSFMAPEQALGRGKQVDARTDLWAIGAILFQFISGQEVHEGATSNEILVNAASRPARSLARASQAPLSVVRLVDRALAYDSAKRFPDAASMRAELHRVLEELSGGPKVAPPRSTAPPSRTGSSRPPATERPLPDAARSFAPGTSRSLAPIPRRPDPRREPTPASESETLAHVDVPAYPPVERVSGPPPRRAAAAPTRAAAAPGRSEPAPARSEPAPARSERAAPRSEPPRARSERAPARSEPAPARASAVPPPRVRGDVSLEAYDPAFAGSGDAPALAEAFRLLEHALFAKVQYGEGHPETTKHFERAFAQCELAVNKSDDALIWHVTPYAFTLGQVVVWEPRAPFDRIPYQLFADGFRLLGMVRGVELREVRELLRILTLDRARDMSPEDDFVTLIWDANFEHILYQAIDSFGDGDQSARSGFQKDADQVSALAHFDTTFQLEDCWAEAERARSTALPAAERQKRLLDLMGGSETRDREALVRAEDFQLRDLGTPLEGAPALDLDQATLSALELKLETDGGIDERFVDVVAAAYEEAKLVGSPASVSIPMRAAVDAIAPTSAESAARLVAAVAASLPESERESFAASVVSQRALRACLTAAFHGAPSRELVESLGKLGSVLGPELVPVVLEFLPQAAEGEVKELLFDYLARQGPGHESELGDMFAKADLELGLALIRLLVRVNSPAARQAVLRAAESPHPVVRISALGSVDGVPGERVRLELQALLEDREPEVRVAALQTIRQHLIRAAGPYLVLRAKSSGFDKLPVEERRQILLALATLAPARAEAVCLEILNEGRLVTLEHHEESRSLAAEVLGQVASTPEALAALEVASKNRWRFSERVRVSANRAREQVEVRLSQPPPPARSGVPPHPASSIPAPHPRRKTQ